MWTPNRSAARALEWGSVLLGAAVKLWLASARTVSGLGWSTYDDVWFLQKAAAIRAGAWLGDYDQMTLIKGPAYPLWIALVSSLGIPLMLAQQALYAVACVAVVRSLSPLVRSRVSRTLLFLVLLFNPMTYADDIANRTTREGFYPAVTLLVLAGVAGVVLRLDSRRAVLGAWSGLAGAAIAVFWLTREEGIWILPLLVCAVLALLRWVRLDPRERWRRGALALGVPLAIVISAHAAVVLTNGRRYRVYEVVEFKAKPFLRAYGGLTHVRQYPSRPRIPVPKEVRERVYAVSPAFAELRPFLEGTLGANWSRNGYPQVRDDIGGAWFMWAFRDAVNVAGYYGRGSEAVRGYYDRVAREIEAARLDGRLDSRRLRPTLLPPILKGQRRMVLRVWFRAAARVVTFADFAANPLYSLGGDEQLRAYFEVARSRMAPREGPVTRVRIAGSAVWNRGPVDVAVESADAGLMDRPAVIRLPSHDPGATRFEARAVAEHAALVLSAGGRTIERVPLNHNPPVSRGPGLRLTVERFALEVATPRLSPADALRFRLMRGVGRAYQVGVPPALLIALLLCLAVTGGIGRWRDEWTVFLLLAGVGFSIAARTLILALIEVTSFDVLIGSYQSPSHALLLVGIGLAAHFGATWYGRWRASRNGG